jgi:hypothetical protein
MSSLRITSSSLKVTNTIQDSNLHNILVEKLQHLQQIIFILVFINDFENLVYQIQWFKMIWDDIFYHDLKNQVKTCSSTFLSHKSIMMNSSDKSLALINEFKIENKFKS